MSSWVTCRCGAVHWGRDGAAGLALTDPHRRILLQLRAAGTHHGRTWSVPGGAVDPYETTTDTALREAAEEVGIDPASVHIIGTHTAHGHGPWSFTYVIGWVPAGTATHPGPETAAITWVPLGDVAATPRLHPDFRTEWPHLLSTMEHLAGRNPS